MKDVSIRHDVRPGDLGRVIAFHGTVYAREYGFDGTFEGYVADGLADFAIVRRAGDRLWLAERGERLLGCIAIVGCNATEAQLRWYLVDPAARGLGLGKHLLSEAIAFCQERGYARIFLWTVSALAAAAKLYRDAGFQKVEERPGKPWGVDVVEEKYILTLARSSAEN